MKRLICDGDKQRIRATAEKNAHFAQVRRPLHQRPRDGVFFEHGCAFGTYSSPLYTSCRIVIDGEIKAIGVAICAPGDQFNRPLGRGISYRRALDQITSDIGNVRGHEYRQWAGEQIKKQGVKLS